MKHPLIISLSLAILLVNCKKSDPGSNPGTAPPITIQVLEKSTNNPIAGATVDLQKCSKYDLVFGCTQYSTTTTSTTNSSGQVTFSRALDWDAFRAQHQNYYSAQVKSIQAIILTPKCTIKASIKRINTYSPGDVLSIEIRDPNCASFLCWSRLYRVGLPNDAILVFDGQGYTDNQVSWSVNSGSHLLPSVYVSGFDTAQVNIEY